MTSGLAHAEIVRLGLSGNDVATLKVMFNPKEFTWSKQNTWKPAKNTNTNIPAYDFGGGQAATLKLQFFFDTYAEGTDVREQHTNAIYQLMIVDKSLTDKKNQKGRPPTVRFQWGKMIGFESVITSISQRFTLFKSDGTPVRAVLDVTFQEAKDPSLLPKQNPTSGGVGGERVWTVKAGETLAVIAFKEYNDPNLWRLIADANRLTRVRRLIPGTLLAIPNA
jgi:nucleoid-associated protein YgaU